MARATKRESGHETRQRNIQQHKQQGRSEPEQQPTPPTQEGEAAHEVGVDVAAERDADEKDATEEELERLVFGDSAGFRDGLKEFARDADDRSTDESLEDAAAAETALEDLDDADLFFTDTGAQNDQYLAPTATSDSDNDTFRTKQPAAWEDSDDERMLVSLASAPRLRKLRRTEADDVVNGKEYASRLRRQFQLLNPMPEWASSAIEKPTRKRRRLSENLDSSEEDAGSADELDLDAELPSVQPLARLLQDAESLVRTSTPRAGKKRKLRPEVLSIQRTKDIAGVQPSAITSLSFHASLPLLLSSGPSSTLYLHQIAASPPAPVVNPLLTSMHIRGTSLTTTAFHPTDSRIFLSARQRYFHIWNLSTGRVEKIARVYGQQHEQRSMERFKLSPDGNHVALLGSARKGGGVVNILSATSLQWIGQVRVESRGGIAEFAWWNDGKGLCIAGKSGEVSEWSLEQQRVVARWQDEGAVGTTTLALGGHMVQNKAPLGNDRWVAIGSSSGIINIYDRRAWLSVPSQTPDQPILPHPKPTKVLDHLTTPTSHLAFSPDGQILAIASRWKRDAMRLVHLPSCTVFTNWPTSSTPLGRITGVAFADGELVGGDVLAVMAVANEQGKIRLWEIR